MIPKTLQVLYLYDIDWDVADTELLNKIALLFYSLLTGEVYISGQVRNQELLTYDNKWNDLEVKYDSSNLVFEFAIGLLSLNNILPVMWDYSTVPLNYKGIICLPFSLIWILLSILAILIADAINYYFFDDKKVPYYRLFGKVIFKFKEK